MVAAAQAVTRGAADAIAVPSTNGTVVAAHHLAPGDPAAPLLIAHATGFHAHCYRPIADALAPRFDVWAADVRGHGATARPAGWPVDWGGYADDVDASSSWLRRRSGRPVSGFGHSMGGALLLDVAARDPERFDRLVLFEPIVFPPAMRTTLDDADGADDPPLAAAARRRRRTFASTAAAIAHYASKAPMNAFTTACLTAYVEYGFEPVDGDDPDGPVQLTCDPDLEGDTFRAGSASQTFEVLAAIAVPVSVIAGRNDRPGPAELAEPVAHSLGSGRFVHRPDLDHFGPFVEPDTVSELALAALC